MRKKNKITLTVVLGITKHPANCSHELNSSYDGAQEASVHHYTKSFRGFSAMLTPDQARKLAGLLHFMLGFSFSVIQSP
ncbi:hypothetical protein LguiA_012416 [Lonicera macranthoides]